jgi:pimeloyl-ACP methyl ester carboxylesterase
LRTDQATQLAHRIANEEGTLIGFVLVHGGHGGAWNWDAVIPLLDAPAVAVDLPGRGGVQAANAPVTFRMCAQAALDAADEAGFTHVVAVGHSMGGFTISALADLAPTRVAHLVYLAALAPPAGSTVFDIYYNSRGADAPRFAEPIVPVRSATEVRERLFADLDDELLAQIHPHMVDEPLSLFEDPFVSPPPSIPRTYVRCARDVPVPPAMATAFIENLGPTTRVIDLDLGHGLIFTDPATTASVLNSALVSVPTS